MMEFVYFIAQDKQHFGGFMLVLMLVGTGLIELVKAARGKT